jgi:hypothetical protein
MKFKRITTVTIISLFIVLILNITPNFPKTKSNPISVQIDATIYNTEVNPWDSSSSITAFVDNNTPEGINIAPQEVNPWN